MARLLVVDDDPRIRRLLEVVLSVQHEEGFRQLWRRAASRGALLRNLLVKGWTEGLLRRILPGPYDLYDLMGHLAYGWPLKTRAERAVGFSPSPLLDRHLEEGLLSEELDALADCLYP